MSLFVKVEVGDLVFDKQQRVEGMVKSIDYKTSTAEVVTESFFKPIASRLSDLVILTVPKEKSLNIKVKYFNSEQTKLTKISQGDWIDLRAAETVELKAGEFKLIPLGIALKLPEGYEAIVAPRSSTFKNFGVIETNSIGVIDNSYSGNDDQWFFPAYALRDTVINFDDRICQFRIQKRMPEVAFTEVDELDGVNRGGHGSTGIK